MKYAIISVSKEGAQLGARVKAGISGEGILYERKGSASGEEAVYFTRTLALTAEIFSCYDGILSSWRPASRSAPSRRMW